MAQVRRARLADAAGIAAVHVESWRTTYADLLPAAYIAERTCKAREAFWTDQLRKDNPGVHIFVACEDDGAICGFASGGPELTSTLGVDGELYSLYLSAAAQGRGLGRRLADSVLTELQRSGARSIAVWVLRENPARGFYERLGGRWLADNQIEIGGETFTEVAYDMGAR
ncbi:MAG: N-acetyltransferase family protein [Bryobacteraceae bacterium]